MSSSESCGGLCCCFLAHHNPLQVQVRPRNIVAPRQQRESSNQFQILFVRTTRGFHRSASDWTFRFVRSSFLFSHGPPKTNTKRPWDSSVSIFPPLKGSCVAVIEILGEKLIAFPPRRKNKPNLKQRRRIGGWMLFVQYAGLGSGLHIANTNHNS